MKPVHAINGKSIHAKAPEAPDSAVCRPTDACARGALRMRSRPDSPAAPTRHQQKQFGRNPFRVIVIKASHTATQEQVGKRIDEVVDVARNDINGIHH